MVFGLAAIKGFGVAGAEAIVEERNSGGAFRGLWDFCRRNAGDRVTRSAIKILAEAGAFDEFGERNAVLAVVEQAAGAGQKHQQDQAVGRISLFGETPEAPAAGPLNEPPLPEVPAMSDEDILEMEKRVLGLYVSAHPLEKNAERVTQCTTARIEDLSEYPTKFPLQIAGLVQEARRHLTRNGDPMMYVGLQGVADATELTVFPSAFESCVNILTPGSLVVVAGKVDRRERNGEGGDGRDGGGAKLLCDKAWPLTEAPKVTKKKKEEAEQARKDYAAKLALPPPPPPPHVVIELDALTMVPEDLRDVRALVEQFPGYHPVILRYLGNGTRRRVGLGQRFRINMDGDFPVRARKLPVVLSIYEEKVASGESPVASGKPPPVQITADDEDWAGYE